MSAGSCTSTKLPKGSKAFYEAVERLRNAAPNCNNKFELAQYCCILCPKDTDCDCEACYVQTVGDLFDPYRKEIQGKTSTGMYSSGIYTDKRAKSIMLTHKVVANGWKRPDVSGFFHFSSDFL